MPDRFLLVKVRAPDVGSLVTPKRVVFEASCPVCEGRGVGEHWAWTEMKRAVGRDAFFEMDEAACFAWMREHLRLNFLPTEEAVCGECEGSGDVSRSAEVVSFTEHAE